MTSEWTADEQDSMAASCGFCWSRPGEPCRTPRGRKRRPHSLRIRRAERRGALGGVGRAILGKLPPPLPRLDPVDMALRDPEETRDPLLLLLPPHRPDLLYLLIGDPGLRSRLSHISSCYYLFMHCHVELLITVSLAEPVNRQDTGLLIKMASGYLAGVGGTPQIQASVSDDALFISVAGMETGKGSVIRSEQLDKDYARNHITKALREAGLTGKKAG